MEFNLLLQVSLSRKRGEFLFVKIMINIMIISLIIASCYFMTKENNGASNS